MSPSSPSFAKWPYRAVGVHRLVVETGADHVKGRHRHRHGHTAHHAPRQHRSPAALPEPLRETLVISSYTPPKKKGSERG